MNARLGQWSCHTIVTVAVAYVPVLIAGLVAAEPGAPVPDPYQAIMELLLIPSVLASVLLFAVLHSTAAQGRRSASAAALSMMTLTAGITICVHVVLLSVGRQADVRTLPGYDFLLAWTWPSVVYALDIAAWDVFFGLALLLGALLVNGWPARLLLVGGVLCLAGLIGAAAGNMIVRDIGIVGYAVVFPVAAFLLGRRFAARAKTEQE